MAELFADFDLERRAPRAQRMLRTLAGSIVLHALFVVSLVYVPAVRDTFQLARTLRGLRVVDEAYNATHVGERATIINLADKFYYPPGYFDVANGRQPVAQLAPTPDVQLVAAYKPPKPSPTPTPQPSPSASSEVARNGQGAAAGASPNASPSASPGASPSASPADVKA